MAETISTNQFKNGMHIEVDGIVYRIVEFQHVKPGKGGAFVRTKLKALESGRSSTRRSARARSCRASSRPSARAVPVRRRRRRDLMDTDTYDQFPLPTRRGRRAAAGCKEGDAVQLLIVDGKPARCSCPRRSSSTSPRPSRASRATPCRT